MPINLTPFNHNPLCYGYTWTINDECRLAEQIAYIALGQSSHVQKILAAANFTPRIPTANAANAAIRLLTVNDGDDPWHRDGWIFQAMSWIAANKAMPNGLIAKPHMIHAQKGFDGIQLKLDNAKNVVAAIIFEDKATENPRKIIREDVLPGFSIFESGERENELTAEIISILQTQHDIDEDAAIETIIWKNIRHYRVSITIGDTHAKNNASHKSLFNDYDTFIKGSLPIDIEKRRAETFYVNNLRDWMEQLAQKAIASIQSKVVTHV
ncbi:MAG: hypothetical protein CTY16_06290 [Methylobacter sp.]|nr:MAG: hypothetical protein CTY16_06290 [Methylobacter sp.]